MAASSGSSANACATRPSSASSCRWPAAGERCDARAVVRSDSRPEYYDFDLFAAAADQRARRPPLADLTYTVFDTETTGLDPSAATRSSRSARCASSTAAAAAGVLRAAGRSAAQHSRRVDPDSRHHAGDGGRRSRRIDEVLPAFHAFAQDTVLVAHNAAFDMRFLQLKEERDRRALRPAGARHAAAVGGDAPQPGSHAWRRSPSASASR